MYDDVYSEKNGMIKVYYRDDDDWRKCGIVIEPDNGDSLFVDYENALCLIQGLAEVLRQVGR